MEKVRLLSEIDIDTLIKRGIKAVVLDIDNTLTPWGEHSVVPHVEAWCIRARQAGLGLYVLSNTANRKRAISIAESIGAKSLEVGHKKPTRGAFEGASRHIGLPPCECVMVGDQLFSDMRCEKFGFNAVLVEPLRKREAKITRLMRLWERVFKGRRITYTLDEK
ncbi:MAG: YqeG family HAD IIIA-type phosphatase [Clostridiales bacterium]|nr:YqeG family HAD IIIA-type phosphatase [Clostridiales bacterium]